MTSVVIDTGPLVALLNRRERHHAWASSILDTIEPPLFTCDPVLSEACFLLQDVTGGQDAVLELVSRGIVRSDFRVYRRNRRQVVPTISPGKGGG